MQVGAELPRRTLAPHRRDDLAVDHERADVGAPGLRDELLHEDVGVELPEGRDDGLRGLLGLGEHDADALRALDELDDERRAADDVCTRPSMSFVECAKPVTGSPMPARARSCSERSLSRERVMACELFSVSTFIISNWRTTAVP